MFRPLAKCFGIAVTIKGFRIAMRAARGNLGAADPRVKRVVGPFDFGIFSHWK